MREKKIVLSAVLGIALVILMITLVAELIDSLTLLTDFTRLNGETDEPYYIIAGVLQLVAVILGILFIVLPFIKKNDKKVKLIITACFLLYIIILIVVLKLTMPTSEYGDRYYTVYYTMYSSYLTFFATAAVTALAYVVTSVMLFSQKSNNEQSAENTEPTDTEKTN